MLCNAAYCGYVSARRDKTKAIKGLHEAIVEEVLFDRVQLMRRERARTLKPGRRSQRYLLRGLARCERCQGNMQGTAVGRKLAPRYYCATRRAGHTCDQPLIHAQLVEEQLVEFVGDFRPAPAICEEILRRLEGTTSADTTEAAERRAFLDERLRRARDLYELGDLTRPEYMARREAINTPSWPSSHPSQSLTSIRPDKCSRTSRSSGAERQTPPPSASSSRSSSSASGWTTSAS